MSRSKRSATNKVCSLKSLSYVLYALYHKKHVSSVILISFTVEKSEDDIEREARLVEQWVGLTEERNAVFVPAPGSGIPGAPANWYVRKSHWSCQLFVHKLCNAARYKSKDVLELPAFCDATNCIQLTESVEGQVLF